MTKLDYLFGYFIEIIRGTIVSIIIQVHFLKRKNYKYLELSLNKEVSIRNFKHFVETNGVDTRPECISLNVPAKSI